MQIGIICSVPDLERYAIYSKFHLILPHLYDKYPAYYEFYKFRATQGDFILQDNSVFELGESLDVNYLIETANKIGATEMSTAEVLGSSEQSYAAVMDTVERSQKLGSTIPLLAVVQGETLELFVDQFFKLNSNPDISTLGIPFDVEHLFTGWELHFNSIRSLTLRRVLSRWQLINVLNFHSKATGVTIKPTHLMGLADGVELQNYDTIPWVRSNDSSSAYVHGLAGILYSDRGLPCEKISTKLDFSTIAKTDTQHKAITHNITQLLQFANVSS